MLISKLENFYASFSLFYLFCQVAISVFAFPCVNKELTSSFLADKIHFQIIVISASHHCELCQLLFPHIIPGPWVPGLAGMRIRELGGKPVHLLHEGNFSVLLCEPEMISGVDSVWAWDDLWDGFSSPCQCTTSASISGSSVHGSGGCAPIAPSSTAWPNWFRGAQAEWDGMGCDVMIFPAKHLLSRNYLFKGYRNH